MNQGSGRLTPSMAFLTIAGVLGIAGLAVRPYSPDPSHPRIARWYRRLNKPAVKPPDPLFGAIWPVLQVLHSYGAFRLMRAPRSANRTSALFFWLADIALVSEWARQFFGRRSLSGGVWTSAALVVSAASFILRASPVDRLAAGVSVPFALWSVFGGLLTETIRERNPRLSAGA